VGGGEKKVADFEGLYDYYENNAFWNNQNFLEKEKRKAFGFDRIFQAKKNKRLLQPRRQKNKIMLREQVFFLYLDSL